MSPSFRAPKPMANLRVLSRNSSQWFAFFYIRRSNLDSNSENGAKIVSEIDQEIQQSQTADNPVAPR